MRRERGERPWQVDLSGLRGEFALWVDFAVPGPEGPRAGRRWWTAAAAQVGPAFDSA
jgi:hypothetical protein